MKFIGSTKDRITKNVNGKNLPQVPLAHCNIVNNYY